MMIQLVIDGHQKTCVFVDNPPRKNDIILTKNIRVEVEWVDDNNTVWCSTL